MKKKNKIKPRLSVEEQIANANEAETLLDSPLFNKTCDWIEDKYISTWANTESSEEELRGHCYYQLQALYAIKEEIQFIINSAKLAKQST